MDTTGSKKAHLDRLNRVSGFLRDLTQLSALERRFEPGLRFFKELFSGFKHTIKTVDEHQEKITGSRRVQALPEPKISLTLFLCLFGNLK